MNVPSLFISEFEHDDEVRRRSTTTKYDDKDVFCYSELGIAVVVVCLRIWRKIE